jgi:hypothetical protein
VATSFDNLETFQDLFATSGRPSMEEDYEGISPEMQAMKERPLSCWSFDSVD